LVDSDPDKQHAGSGEKDNPSSALTRERGVGENDVSSFRRHSMDYVDPVQIASQTGYTDKRDWYLLIIKELIDNAVDFLQTNYKGSINEKITIKIRVDAENLLFYYKVANTNSKPWKYPVFGDLKDILNFEMRYGSKQNEHRILMGTLGDAMKRVAAFGYVFAQADNQGIDSKGKDWDQPMIFRANGTTEHKALIHIDNLKQEVKADIYTTEEKRLPHTDTVIENTIPLIAQARDDTHFPAKIAEYCRKRVAFTTDISFDIEYSDSRFEGAWKLQVDALHPIYSKWNNLSSVYYSTPKEFADRFRDVFNRERTTMYKVLKTFRETTQISRATFLSDIGIDVDMSVEEFLQKYREGYDKKTDSLYYYLRGALPPAAELSLPYYAPPEISRHMRTETLARRITRVFDQEGDKYDADRAVYKIVRGENIRTIKGLSPDGSGDLEIRYPYAVEIIAIPMKRTYLYGIDDNDLLTKEKCKFIGAINNCVSPKDTKFRDFGRKRYGWMIREDDPQMEEIEADDVEDVLAAAGFPFPGFEVKPRTKIPCIIVINLTSPKLDYIGTSKTDIDVGPFIEAIKQAVEAVAREKGVIRTYKGVGIQISNKGKVIYVNERPEGKQETYVVDVIEMLPLIKNRLELVKSAKALGKKLPVFDERTQDSIWYNCLPMWGDKKYGSVAKPTREHFKNALQVMCDRNNVTREELGIIASPWAAMYFEGIWRLVSYDAITELAKKGVTLIFIEKRDIVQSLGPYASRYGVALVNSRGFLVEYAIMLAEAAKEGGAHIAIMTDYDVSGIMIARELKDAIWLGCDERMLKRFGIKQEDKDYAVDYDASVARTNEYDLQHILDTDKRFAHVDIDFIRKKRVDYKIVEGKRVELDAVLARAGEEECGGSPEALWNYMMELIEEAHPIQDYTRVIESKSSTLSNYYPEPYRQLTIFVEQYVDEIIKPKRKQIESELKETVGLIDVKEKKEEIDKDEGKIITNNKLMKKIGKAIKEIDKQYNFGISKVTTTSPLAENDVKEEEAGKKKARNALSNHQYAVLSEIPDPSITEEAVKMSKMAGNKSRMTPLWWTKFLFIKEHGSEEMIKELEQGRGCDCDIEAMYNRVVLRQRAKQILQQRKQQMIQQSNEEDDAKDTHDDIIERLRILSGGKISEDRLKEMAAKSKEYRKKRETEEIKHTFPYPGLPDEERAKELHEDQRFYHQVLADNPDKNDRAYYELKLSEVEHELHKLYERGIGDYIAGSEHDPDREAYNQS
jgi:hypothetical protein